MRSKIKALIEEMIPMDAEEKEHQREAINWIDSGVEIYRLKKPDHPPKHLVCYCAIIDPQASKILLVDHIAADLWLPPGGHVEKGELPIQAAEREILEELGVKASFFYPKPFFIDVKETSNDLVPHTDVNLWFLIQGSLQEVYSHDQTEFTSIQWFPFDQIPIDRTHPELNRFLKKVKSFFMSERTSNLISHYPV